MPPQNCCGLPLLSNGEFPAARHHHQSNVEHLISYARQGIPIVGTSTSCTLTLKEEAPELLDMYDDDVHQVAIHTYDFNEFVLHALADNLELPVLKSIQLKLRIPCAVPIPRPSTWETGI